MKVLSIGKENFANLVNLIIEELKKWRKKLIIKILLIFLYKV